MDMIKNTWRQLVSIVCGHTDQGFWKQRCWNIQFSPYCAEKAACVGPTTFGFHLGAKQNQSTTTLSLYLDKYDPQILMEVKLEADTSWSSFLHLCATLGFDCISRLSNDYLRAERLTNTATLRSRGSVHRTPLDESEWEMFQACELIRLHVWF